MWEPCHKLFTVTLIDGTRANGMLMRRRTGRWRWEYRSMTTDEHRLYVTPFEQGKQVYCRSMQDQDHA